MPISTEPVKTIIIGAGLTGLILANRLQREGSVIRLIEKSKSVGGRMATRRSEAARFDHGAQFYTLQTPLAETHQRWVDASLASYWFNEKGKSHFKCSSGMTALAKELARGFNIEFEKRLLALSNSDNCWKLQLESGEEREAERVVITAPLPQSLEILRQSHIGFDPSLENIRYAKAVVALIETEVTDVALAGANGYLEPQLPSIFSISDQKIKGLSAKPAFTVTLKPDASESLYNLADDVLAAAITSELRSIDQSFQVSAIQIKKWRYANPLNRFHSPYSSPAANLYLAGDAFGGASLVGAARSANALADSLLSGRR